VKISAFGSLLFIGNLLLGCASDPGATLSGPLSFPLEGTASFLGIAHCSGQSLPRDFGVMFEENCQGYGRAVALQIAADADVGPGTYDIEPSPEEPSTCAQGYSATVALGKTTVNIPSPFTPATSGHVKIDSIEGGDVQGSFEATFPLEDGGTSVLSGTFGISGRGSCS
jgi:hypothetical protein